MNRALTGPSLFLLLFVACGEAEPDTLRHDFPSVRLQPGEERYDLCQSWTLDNDQPLYVSSVEMNNGTSWHHSNWTFVPDTRFPGPDGLWSCSERNYDSLAAGLAGGVLYAQSTQATSEIQQFMPGAAIVIPEHSTIIGETHALNVSGAAVETALSLTLHTLPADEVEIPLLPLVLQYHPLHIPSMASSIFTLECDLDRLHRKLLERPLDMRIHYVMPHYHSLGTGLRIEVLGGADDGKLIFASASRAGEPVGGAVDPPFSLAGATGLRTSCSNENPRSEEVGWGLGDQEMCVLLAFTDSELFWAGGADEGSENEMVGTDSDGTVLNRSDCNIYSFPPRQ